MISGGIKKAGSSGNQSNDPVFYYVLRAAIIRSKREKILSHFHKSVMSRIFND